MRADDENLGCWRAGCRDGGSGARRGLVPERGDPPGASGRVAAQARVPVPVVFDADQGNPQHSSGELGSYFVVGAPRVVSRSP